MAVSGVHLAPPAFVVAQIEAVVGDLGCDAVKTGMLATAAIVEAVAAAIARLRLPNLVVDPVMVAKSGDHLLAADAVEAIRRTLAAAGASRHAQHSRGGGPHRAADPHPRGRRPRRPRAAGHGRAVRWWSRAATSIATTSSTCWWTATVRSRSSANECPGVHTHGTGCTFASAIAARLALGDDVEPAVRAAQAYVRAAMRTGIPLGGGHRPLDHLWKARAAGILDD